MVNIINLMDCPKQFIQSIVNGAICSRTVKGVKSKYKLHNLERQEVSVVESVSAPVSVLRVPRGNDDDFTGCTGLKAWLNQMNYERH